MSILEEELYIPVKKYFENKGFKIKGEVKNCDMAGVKGDILLVVELKRNFNLKLVYQVLTGRKSRIMYTSLYLDPKILKEKKFLL